MSSIRAVRRQMLDDEDRGFARVSSTECRPEVLVALSLLHSGPRE